ncbi:MAG: TIGR02391 family protein [Firmicutes bacterium]|nr:TIGR02391 family protein [Bacillota bacterium]
MTPTNEKPLELKFDPRTIEHLGIKMYSQIPYALAELVSNAYDANATRVEIELNDAGNDKQIIISDNGDGMTYDEVRDNFLVIGRRRRDEDKKRENAKKRKITGRKGLGKLALFGIGKNIEIVTKTTKEKIETSLTLNWDSILNESSGIYTPPSNKRVNNSNQCGTKITLSQLSRVTDFDEFSTAASLSKLFNCFGKDFLVSVSRNGGKKVELSRDLIYTNLNEEFSWDVKKLSEKVESDYRYKNELKGKILSTIKPIRQDLRGITLYVNGRLANIPCFFGYKEAGHAFSYVTGWIEADFLDEFEKDLISTDRQSLSWDMEEAEQLQKHLQKMITQIVKDWSIGRKNAKENKVSEKVGINITEWIDKVPDKIRTRLSSVIMKISDKPEIDNEEFSAVIKDVHELLPPYTYFHYRELHNDVKSSAENSYKKRDYYKAFSESIKKYLNAVKDKAEIISDDDNHILNTAFGIDSTKILKATAKYSPKPTGKFRQKTLDNIEAAQRDLSVGILTGARNVLAHEEETSLRDEGLFTEKDCLDMLCLLSHLFKRLDESEKR